jgi:hypothetical protein
MEGHIQVEQGPLQTHMMFFGLINSLATFQEMVNSIFAEEIYERHIIIYLDDTGLQREMNDEFMMYTFKVAACRKNHPRDWRGCSYLHPGEDAGRRDPRRCRWIRT